MKLQLIDQDFVQVLRTDGMRGLRHETDVRTETMKVAAPT